MEELADLAMEIESELIIDWSRFKISKEELYKKMAESVYNQFDRLDKEQIETVALATVVKLLVENFILKTQLQQVSNEQ